MALKGVVFYVVVTLVTTFVLRGALTSPSVVAVSAVTAGSPAYALSQRRRRHAPQMPLVFDDELPMEVNPLRLNAD